VPSREGNGVTLKDILILFDRDFGVSIFPNFRGYNNPVDDAEWLLERSMISRGFVIRPIVREGRRGLWIGEYIGSNSVVTKTEEVYGEYASKIHRLMLKCMAKETSKRRLLEELSITSLKRLESKIIRGFKYYICPPSHFYQECREVERIYKLLREKYKDGGRVFYSLVADEILRIIRCEDAVVCPLKAPNALERIHNLNKALRSRGIGEFRFTEPSFVEIV